MTRPTGGKLAAENERLRERIEALERLAAESRLAEEVRRESAERSRRHAAERRQREADVLALVTREVNASLDLSTVLQKVAEAARELCACDMVGIALRETDSDAMIFRHWAGLRGLNTSSLRVRGGTGIAARVLETGRPFRSEDYARDARFSKDYVATAEQETIAALMCVPIRVGDRIEGLIYVGSREARAFTDADEGMVLRLADHAAIAILNARQFRSHQRRVDELAALHEVARVVAGTAESAALFAVIRRELGRLADTRHMLALLRAGDVFEVAYTADPEGALRAGTRLVNGAGLADLVFARREPIRTTEYLETCRREGVEATPFAPEWAHALVVPLLAAGRPHGVLALWSDTRPFSRADEQLLTTVGSLAALALTARA